jgi:predicted transcriptional regulator
MREKGGLGITNIMYGSYLSYGQVDRFLKLLKEKGMLLFDENIARYKITERGLQYLELYEKMDDLLKEGRPSITDSLFLLLCYIVYPFLPVLGEFI